MTSKSFSLFTRAGRHAKRAHTTYFHRPACHLTPDSRTYFTNPDYVIEEAKQVVLPEEYRDTSRIVETNATDAIRKHRCDVFDNEYKRQRSLIPRIDKISVRYEGMEHLPGHTMLLNRHLSTPYNVAQHISDTMMDISALASVNGQIWDMNRPLVEDCTVEFLTFHDKDPFAVNRAFWRSCSFMLGGIIENIFSDKLKVTLHSFPSMPVTSGSFVSDARIVDATTGNSIDWTPTRIEMQSFSAAMHRLAEQSLPFQRLDVSLKVAENMFKDNEFKLSQLTSIVQKKGDNITVYRMGDHVDISSGPLMGNSSFVGRRCSIVAAHPIVTEGIGLIRFQGVALPKSIHLNHFAFGILEKRAAKLNRSGQSEGS